MLRRINIQRYLISELGSLEVLGVVTSLVYVKRVWSKSFVDFCKSSLDHTELILLSTIRLYAMWIHRIFGWFCAKTSNGPEVHDGMLILLEDTTVQSPDSCLILFSCHFHINILLSSCISTCCVSTSFQCSWFHYDGWHVFTILEIIKLLHFWWQSEHHPWWFKPSSLYLVWMTLEKSLPLKWLALL